METLKKLRDKTGAGISDCKKALDEASGDIEKAVEILRKKGISKASKRSDRETTEGIVKVLTDESDKEGYIVKINSETDFVSRNEKFQDLSDSIVNVIKEKKPANLEDLLSLAMENGSVKETVESLSGVIGEKLEISNLDVLKGEKVSAYSHMGGKIGVLVSFDKDVDNVLAQDIAMQIAATDPKYLKPEDVKEEELNKEKEIYKEQLIKEGKPENILDKIIEGKINKYYENVCLIKQEFIKEDKKKVEEVLGDVNILKFIRYSL